METTQTSARDWLRVMSERLQQQWPTVDPQRLDDLALDLWRDERLRAMPAREAAEVWLQPVMLREPSPRHLPEQFATQKN